MWGTTKGEFRGDHITTADAGGSPRFATTHPQPSPPTFAALPDSPSILGSRQTNSAPEHIRQYQLFLSQQKRASLSHYIQVVSGLRFFYTHTLHRQIAINHHCAMASTAKVGVSWLEPTKPAPRSE